jgi:hypothetical protein
MPDLLLFWKPRPDLKLTPAAVARELLWGEEVDGLIDLPIKEVIDRLKVEFPDHREMPGLLVLKADAGRCEATWSWQHVRAELHDLADVDRQRLIAAMEGFGCQHLEGQA